MPVTIEPALRSSSPAAVREAVERARAAPRLAVLLDYDGTLVPLAPRPELAVPGPELLELLARVAARPGAEVHVVSGRERGSLERWLGALPLGLHAEHGFWSRPLGGKWIPAALPFGGWRELALACLSEATARLPGSFIEEKSAGLAWHCRQCDPLERGARTAELIASLSRALAGSPAEVLPGDAVIEVRLRGIHKGRAVAQVRAFAAPGTLFLAIGDDRTDEDLFAALPDGSLAVHVGPAPSRAPLRLADVAAARAFLSEIAADE